VESLNAAHVQIELPDEFKGYYDAQKYAESQKYLKVNTRFGIAEETFFTVVKTLFIVFGGFNLADIFARSFKLGPVFTGLVFAGSVLFCFSLLGIPFSVYSTFVIEEKFGFNKTTPKTFILDLLKGWLLALLIGGPVFACVLWIFAKTGSLAWLFCWAAVSAISILLTFVAPILIMPLFNKFIPVEEGELKSGLENYAKEQSFKMKGPVPMA